MTFIYHIYKIKMCGVMLSVRRLWYALKRINNTPHKYQKCNKSHKLIQVKNVMFPRFMWNLPDFRTRMNNTLSSNMSSRYLLNDKYRKCFWQSSWGIEIFGQQLIILLKFASWNWFSSRTAIWWYVVRHTSLCIAITVTLYTKGRVLLIYCF